MILPPEGTDVELQVPWNRSEYGIQYHDSWARMSSLSHCNGQRTVCYLVVCTIERSFVFLLILLLLRRAIHGAF